jgi:3-methyladenine DNA glycosylase AlkD
MQEDLISSIQKELERHADEKTAQSGDRFFKEPVKIYGVQTAVVNRIARTYFLQIRHLDKQQIFNLCEQLLKTDYCEDAFIAFDWSYKLHDKYRPEDMEIFENWLNNYVNNWAKCDTLCNHTIGSFIEKYPEYIDRLKQWARSENRWVKRAAAVTLVLPARRGKFLNDIFQIAGILLLDKDDLVQKGYGWMLKEASRQHQQEVLDYVIQNKKEMPRTALRYAIEKMPPELRQRAMSKD